jgi:hypothetical protein
VGKLVKSKAEISKQFEQHLALSKKALSRQWDNTRTAQQFYTGDSMSYLDHLQFVNPRGEKKRALIQFNKVMPFVDAVAGFMTQNRRVAKYVARIPFAPKQEAYSVRCNATSSYIRAHANSDQLETEQDLDMLINGYGAVETDISYILGNATVLPNGEILMNRLDPLTTFWDAVAKRKNLSDRRFCGYWQDYDIKDALALFPDSDSAEFGNAVPNDSDEEYYYDPFGGRYDKVSYGNSLEWANKQEDLVRVYNYQWFEYEKYYQADNPAYTMQSGEAKILAMQQMQMISDEMERGFEDMFTFDPTARVLTFDRETKNKLVEIFGKYIQPVEWVRKRYYTAIISGKTVFKAFSSICQQDFSIQFKTGTYDPNRKIWMGMVNSMMNPMLYYNKALTELMFTIASNSKGGVLVEKGAVEDIQEFEQKYASTTAVIETEEGAISGGKIMPKGQNVPTTGLDNILVLTDQAIADSAGVDKSFLGSNENKQETGILFRRRIRQVVSTLAKYFDSITLYQKNNARLMLDYIRVWSENNQGALIELTDENGQYSTQEIRQEPFMCEYGITIQEAPQTPEDKEETAEMISTIADKVALIKPQAALKIYAVAVKSTNLDAEDKKQIMEAMGGDEIDPMEYEQLKQQVAMLASETNKAEVENKLAQSGKYQADAQLALAKAQEIPANIQHKSTLSVKTLEEAQRTDADTRKIEAETIQIKKTPVQQLGA